MLLKAMKPCVANSDLVCKNSALPLKCRPCKSSLILAPKVKRAQITGNSRLKHSQTLPRARDVRTQIWPFDVAWDIDSQNLASNLFASSIIPYAGFLYHLQRSKKAPKLMLFGFYFLLVFVFATIVAGVTAKLKYGSILANVDWLHGSAESFLTFTNLFIVLGLRQGILEAEKENLAAAEQKRSSQPEETVERQNS